MRIKSILNACAFICASVVWTLTSCGEKNPEDEFYHPDKLVEFSFPEKCDTLYGKLVDSWMGRPTFIQVCDTFLVISDHAAEPNFFSVRSTNSDSVLLEFGQQGNAKNEFYDTASDFYMNKESNGDVLMYVQQRGVSLTKVVNMTKTVEEGCCVVERIEKDKIVPQTESYNERYFIAANNRYVLYQGLNFADFRDVEGYTPPRFIITDGKTEKTVSCFPKLIGNIKIPFGYRAGAYIGIPAISPDKSKIILVMHSVNCMNILDIKTEKILGVQDKNSYTFIEVEKNTSDSFDYHYGWCDHFVAGSYIFILYDGRKLNQVKDDKNRNLLVFDYEGNLVNAFVISDGVGHIAYDEKNKVLYAAHQRLDMKEDMDAYLYKYDLSKYLK